LQTLASTYGRAGQKKYLTTLTPQSASTDSWATLVNQTPHNPGGEQARRAAHNDNIRAGAVSGFDGYLDVASILESSVNSDLWVVNGSANYAEAGDGLHPNAAGNDLVGTYINANLSKFVYASNDSFERMLAANSNTPRMRQVARDVAASYGVVALRK
jgi:hypothetical protein